jgi:hypothetical protein
MELITSSGFSGKIITTIGINAVCASITTITSAAKNIYDVIGGISRSKTPEQSNVMDLIVSLDLEQTIKEVESLLKEIPKDKMNSKTLQLCLDGLTDILKKIEMELHRIDGMLRYNNTLWFLKTFRAYDCSQNMEKVKELSNILDKRLKRFFYILENKTELKHDNSDEKDNILRNDKELILVSNTGEMSDTTLL